MRNLQVFFAKIWWQKAHIFRLLNISEIKPRSKVEYINCNFLEFKMKLILSFLILFSFSVNAMDAGMMDMLKGMKIDKAEVSKMLDSMVKMGRITPEQAAKARKELNGLNDKDFEKYSEMAKKKIQSGAANNMINQNLKNKKEPASVAPSKKSVIKSKKEESLEESIDNTTIDFSKIGQ